MRVEHLAIDGSVVSIEAEAELTTPATATGWAIVPSLMQAHPFSIFPTGHTALLEEAARSSVPSLEVLITEEYTIKDGTLRIAEVELPAATGGKSHITVGAWEGPGGCLHTSMWGAERARLIEAFETLSFSAHSRGLAIDGPVVAQPRAPEVIKEIPEIGVLNIRPAIPSELERVPKTRGFMANHGELFRMRQTGYSMLFVGNSTVVTVNPLPATPTDRVLEITQGLRIEWLPRGSVGTN
jgi:hypothetical protein